MTTFINSKALKLALGLVVAFAFVASAASAQAITFTRTLKKGMSGDDVKAVQQFLNTTQFKVAASGAGSPGSETKYFGPATDTAVKAFQVNYNIVSPGILGYGWVGPKTQAKINELMSGSSGSGVQGNCPAGYVQVTPVAPLFAACALAGNTGPVVAGAVTASVAADSPVSNYFATGTSNNPVLKINIANGSASSVNVTSVKLTKSGFYANTNVTGVAAYDAAGVRHGNVITTLGSDGMALLTFNSDPIVIPAGQSASVLFRVHIASGSNTGTLSFGVMNPSMDIGLSAGTVSGNALMGSLFSVVDGSNNIASVTVDVQPVNASGTTVNADGVSVQEVTKFRLVETSSNEDVKLYKLTLWNNGNAADGDLQDVQLFDQSNNLLATAQMVNKTVTFDLSANPFLITEGQTKDFTVKAKFVNGASRTVQFVVYNDYDVDVRGVSTMAGVLPTAAGGVDSTFPIGDTTSTYNKVTVGSGSLILSRASDSPATAVVPGASSVVLAKYLARPVGENMEVRGIAFGLDQNTGSVDLTGTVYVKVNGQTVFSGAASGFASAGTSAARSLSSYPVLTAGVDNVIEVIATLSSSATTSDAYFVNDFDITSVKRLITNDITDPSVSVQDGFTRSVQAAALTVSTLTTPVATTIIPGSVDNHLASIEFNAQSSGEPVRISSVTIADTIGGSAALTDVYNLIMKDASGNVITTTSSTATNAATVAFNFTNAIEVTPTTPVTVKLYGSVISGATTGATSAYAHTFDVSSVTATGKTTGNSISSPTISGAGQAMTINSGGSLTLSTVTGSGATPSVSQLVAINQLDGVYLAGRFTAQYEAQKITSLTLEAAGTALTSNNLKNIRLYAQNGTGALLGATAPFVTIPQFSSCSSNVCSYTFTSTDNILPMQINPGTPVTLFVKADIEGEGVSKLGNDFYFRVQNGADVVAKGALSQSTTTESGNFNDSATAVSYVVPFSVVSSGVYPSDGSSTTSTVGAGTTLGRFKITNNGSAKVTITDIDFTDSGSHISTGGDATYRLYVSDQNASNYTAYTVETSSTDSVAFGSLASTTNTYINGGSYRYFTVVLQTVDTNNQSGDNWALSISSLGDVMYSVAETDLGYDGEQDGDITGTITGLIADGKPVLGTIIEQ